MPTRRHFLRRAGTGAAVAVLAPQELVLPAHGASSRRLFRSGRFADGIVAGDPTARSIALWTRVTDAEGSGRVQLEVARDDDFRHLVASRTVHTDETVNHAVKARVKGLKPHTDYFYRFTTAKHDSKVGRFRTALPADSRQPVRFAYFSCQDYTHGYFNAHEVMLKEDVDFIVCLGDYIYAESYNSVAGGTGVRDDLIGSPSISPNYEREALTLADYRAKYSLYRSDPALRKLHERFAMVYIPDDHEVQDNYAGGVPDGGLGPETRFSPARKRAARKAFFESSPRFPDGKRLYRTLNFGRTVELFIMDQRAHRANQPCNDATAPPCADLYQPRAFLGRTQLDWLKKRLSASRATWKVMANEVTIMPTMVLNGAFVAYDSWQGYPLEREELLTHIRDKQIQDVVFVTGDIHTFIAGDVRTDLGKGEPVAVEFVAGSISSIGFGESVLPAGNGAVITGNDANPATDPALVATLRGLNPWVDQADLDHHGYGVIEASTKGLSSRFVRMQTIKARTRATLPETGFTYRLERGQTSIKGVNGPVA
jgi:alkaline phosphatase D